MAVFATSIAAVVSLTHWHRNLALGLVLSLITVTALLATCAVQQKSDDEGLALLTSSDRVQRLKVLRPAVRRVQSWIGPGITEGSVSRRLVLLGLMSLASGLALFLSFALTMTLATLPHEDLVSYILGQPRLVKVLVVGVCWGATIGGPSLILSGRILNALACNARGRSVEAIASAALAVLFYGALMLRIAWHATALQRIVAVDFFAAPLLVPTILLFAAARWKVGPGLVLLQVVLANLVHQKARLEKG